MKESEKMSLRIVKVHRQDGYPSFPDKASLERAGVRDAQRLKGDKEWLANIKLPYDAFKRAEGGTELSRDEYATYQKAALAELKKIGV